MGKSHKWVTIPAALAVLAAGLAVWAASRPAEIPFAEHLIDPGAYETCAIGDIKSFLRAPTLKSRNSMNK